MPAAISLQYRSCAGKTCVVGDAGIFSLYNSSVQTKKVTVQTCMFTAQIA